MLVCRLFPLLAPAHAHISIDDTVAQLQLRPKLGDDDVTDELVELQHPGEVVEPQHAAMSYHGMSTLGMSLPYHKNATSLLETRASTTPSGLPQFPAHVPLPDFSGSVVMDREFVADYPQELYASIPAAQNDITYFKLPVKGAPHLVPCEQECAIYTAQNIDCTCLEYVSFPMDQHLTGVLGKRKTEAGVEYGEIKWIGDTNPSGSVVPGSVWGFAERFHVLSDTGSPLQASVPPTLTEDEEFTAKNGAVVRTAALLDFMGHAPLQTTYLEAAQDPLHLYAMREYISNNPMVKPEDASEVINNANDAVNTASPLVQQGTVPSKVGTNCLHFIQATTPQNENLINFANGRAIVPLNVKLPTVRGQTFFSPEYELSVAVGHGFFTKNGDNLVFYQGTTSFGSYDIERNGYGTPGPTSTFKSPPKLKLCIECFGDLMVKHPHTTTMVPARLLVPAQDVRGVPPAMGGVLPNVAAFHAIKDNAAAMTVLNEKFKFYAGMSMSHTYLFQNQRTICPDTHYQQVEAQAAGMDVMAMAADGMSPPEAMSFVMHIISALPCGISFLRGSSDAGNGIDALEITVFSHFMMEWPPEHRMHAVRGDTSEEDGVLTNGWHHKEMIE